MAERVRKNELKVFLSDDEKFILDEKWKISEMPSKSAFIRKLIIYGYVYDVNYEDLRQYNKELNAIGNNVNQIVRLCQKTGNVYAEDISEIKELLEKIWHIQESILSRQP